MRHLTAKSEFRAPKGSVSQASAAAGSSSRRETVHSEPFQDTSRPESTCDPSSQRGITELKDIVVKKFGDEKPDDPRLGFCDFLKLEVVQLTSDSYDEFQQETFNLLMRLKHRDKQQQRYQHRMHTRMVQTVITQCLTHRCRDNISRCNRLLHM